MYDFISRNTEMVCKFENVELNVFADFYIAIDEISVDICLENISLDSFIVILESFKKCSSNLLTLFHYSNSLFLKIFIYRLCNQLFL